MTMSGSNTFHCPQLVLLDAKQVQKGARSIALPTTDAVVCRMWLEWVISAMPRALYYG